jgi:hypothetical protein
MSEIEVIPQQDVVFLYTQIVNDLRNCLSQYNLLETTDDHAIVVNKILLNSDGWYLEEYKVFFDVLVGLWIKLLNNQPLPNLELPSPLFHKKDDVPLLLNKVFTSKDNALTGGKTRQSNQQHPRKVAAYKSNRPKGLYPFAGGAETLRPFSVLMDVVQGQPTGSPASQTYLATLVAIYLKCSLWFTQIYRMQKYIKEIDKIVSPMIQYIETTHEIFDFREGAVTDFLQMQLSELNNTKASYAAAINAAKAGNLGIDGLVETNNQLRNTSNYCKQIEDQVMNIQQLLVATQYEVDSQVYKDYLRVCFYANNLLPLLQDIHLLLQTNMDLPQLMQLLSRLGNQQGGASQIAKQALAQLTLHKNTLDNTLLQLPSTSPRTPNARQLSVVVRKALTDIVQEVQNVMTALSSESVPAFDASLAFHANVQTLLSTLEGPLVENESINNLLTTFERQLAITADVDVVAGAEEAAQYLEKVQRDIDALKQEQPPDMLTQLQDIHSRFEQNTKGRRIEDKQSEYLNLLSTTQEKVQKYLLENQVSPGGRLAIKNSFEQLQREKKEDLQKLINETPDQLLEKLTDAVTKLRGEMATYVTTLPQYLQQLVVTPFMGQGKNYLKRLKQKREEAASVAPSASEAKGDHDSVLERVNEALSNLENEKTQTFEVLKARVRVLPNLTATDVSDIEREVVRADDIMSQLIYQTRGSKRVGRARAGVEALEAVLRRKLNNLVSDIERVISVKSAPVPVITVSTPVPAVNETAEEQRIREIVVREGERFKVYMETTLASLKRLLTIPEHVKQQLKTILEGALRSWNSLSVTPVSRDVLQRLRALSQDTQSLINNILINSPLPYAAELQNTFKEQLKLALQYVFKEMNNISKFYPGSHSTLRNFWECVKGKINQVSVGPEPIGEKIENLKYRIEKVKLKYEELLESIITQMKNEAKVLAQQAKNAIQNVFDVEYVMSTLKSDDDKQNFLSNTVSGAIRAAQLIVPQLDTTLHALQTAMDAAGLLETDEELTEFKQLLFQTYLMQLSTVSKINENLAAFIQDLLAAVVDSKFSLQNQSLLVKKVLQERRFLQQLYMDPAINTLEKDTQAVGVLNTVYNELVTAQNQTDLYNANEDATAEQAAQDQANAAVEIQMQILVQNMAQNPVSPIPATPRVSTLGSYIVTKLPLFREQFMKNMTALMNVAPKMDLKTFAQSLNLCTTNQEVVKYKVKQILTSNKTVDDSKRLIDDTFNELKQNVMDYETNMQLVYNDVPTLVVTNSNEKEIRTSLRSVGYIMLNYNYKHLEALCYPTHSSSFVVLSMDQSLQNRFQMLTRECLSASSVTQQLKTSILNKKQEIRKIVKDLPAIQ